MLKQEIARPGHEFSASGVKSITKSGAQQDRK